MSAVFSPDQLIERRRRPVRPIAGPFWLDGKTARWRGLRLHANLMEPAMAVFSIVIMVVTVIMVVIMIMSGVLSVGRVMLVMAFVVVGMRLMGINCATPPPLTGSGPDSSTSSWAPASRWWAPLPLEQQILGRNPRRWTAYDRDRMRGC